MPHRDSHFIENYEPFITKEVNNPTPDWAYPDNGYRGFLAGLNCQLINFYNTDDFALATGSYPLFGQTNWEANQLNYKPDYPPSETGLIYRYFSADPRTQLWATYTHNGHEKIRNVTDPHEVMSFIARPLSKAVGALAGIGAPLANELNVGEGSASDFSDTRSDHSGQFTRSIQKLQPFYQQLMEKLQLTSPQ
jgi:hypothetical protein